MLPAARSILCLLAFAAFTPSIAPAGDRPDIVATLAVPSPAWSGPAAPTHDVRLQLYAFADTRWRAGDILAAVREGLPLLAQCGVALAGAELRLLAGPREFHYYSTPVARRLLNSLAVSRPAIFFVEDTLSDPAFDAEAIGRGNSSTRPELADTVWIAYGARDLPVTLAHELTHVLADSGEHSNEAGNLMLADTSPANTRLTPGQCERLRARGTANGLLERRANP